MIRSSSDSLYVLIVLFVIFEALIILRSYTKFKKHLRNMNEANDEKTF